MVGVLLQISNSCDKQLLFLTTKIPCAVGVGLYGLDCVDLSGKMLKETVTGGEETENFGSLKN